MYCVLPAVKAVAAWRTGGHRRKSRLYGAAEIFMVEASHFVQILEQRQGTRVACPEEIALRLGYITIDQFAKLAARCAKSSYGEYLASVHRSIVRAGGPALSARP